MLCSTRARNRSSIGERARNGYNQGSGPIATTVREGLAEMRGAHPLIKLVSACLSRLVQSISSALPIELVAGEPFVNQGGSLAIGLGRKRYRSPLHRRRIWPPPPLESLQRVRSPLTESRPATAY